MRRKQCAALLGLLLAASAVPAAAAPLALEASYVVRLYGLTIGRATFAGTVDGARYDFTGSLASAGLARVFERIDATAQVGGQVAAGGATPARFVLDYVSGGARSRTDISFNRGNAASVSVTPEPDLSPQIVPVSRADLRSVADPVSATLVARGTPQQVCGRTLRIFEGGTRVDVRLSLVEVGNVYGVGNGAVTCRGELIAVSGYDRTSSSWPFMREKGDLRFVYAPAGAGLYTLHELSATTEIGRVEMKAARRKVAPAG